MKAGFDPQLQLGQPPHENVVAHDTVAQNRENYAAQLHEQFAEPDSQQYFDLNEVAALLGGERAAIIYAMKQRGMLPDRPDYYEWTATKVNDQARQGFSQSDVLALNEDPMSRARSYRQLPEYLAVEPTILTIVIDELGLPPLRPFARQKYGYYDENQIELIRTAVVEKTTQGSVKGKNNPQTRGIGNTPGSSEISEVEQSGEERLIPRDRIARVLKLTGLELQEYIDVLGISERIRVVDERTKRVARFLTSADALSMAQEVLTQQNRKKTLGRLANRGNLA